MDNTALIRQHQAELNKLLAQYNKDVEKKNVKFSRMSDSQKRVAIAKDVLSQISEKRILAVPGSWAVLIMDNEQAANDAQNNEKSIQKILDTEVKSCEACALGAAYLCAVRLGNDVTADELTAEVDSELAGTHDNVYDHLGQFFDKDQLDAIEAAFERGTGWVKDRESAPTLEYYETEADFAERKKEFAVRQDLIKRAIAFTKGVKNATKRLQMVWQNVIDNKGTFKP